MVVRLGGYDAVSVYSLICSYMFMLRKGLKSILMSARGKIVL